MDLVMAHFFRDVFCELERDCLHADFRRRQLCDYLSTLIRACSQADGSTEGTCDKAVLGAIQYHRRAKVKNGKVCLMGKYHNVLYVAARIAFKFNLQNSTTVGELLKEMFDCEKTFERLMTGAIFGPKICSVFSGWKCEFDDRLECLQVLKYFLHHAMLAKIDFNLHSKNIRMADIPLQTCMQGSPATVAVYAQRPDVFQLLIEYGAKIHQLPYGLLSPLKMLDEMKTTNPAMTIPMTACFMIAEMTRPSGVDGWSVPSLKHLSRYTIRQSLNDNFQLPLGVESLPLPSCLVRYISLEEK